MVYRTILLLALALTLAGCGGPSEPTATPDPGNATLAPESRLLDSGTGLPDTGDPAPDFSYTLADGTSVQLSELRGKKVVLNFWATWCVPCAQEMPELQRAADRDGLVVLAVNRNELPEAIARFAPTVGVRFPLIANISGDIADRYRVTALPTTYFIHSDGTIAARQLGALTSERLDTLITTLK